MLVNQAFRYELDPNNAQKTAFAKHAGAARFAFNWGLELCRRLLDAKESVPSAVDLHKRWNAWKRENAPWWVEVSKCAPQEALRDLRRAFDNLFAGRAGFPRFRRKWEDDRFRLTGSIRVLPGHVVLPRIGKVRVKEATGKFRGRILSATVTREADRWFVSLAVEAERAEPTPVRGEPAGVDLGFRSFAVLSDGARIEAPKPLKRLLRKLRRLSRAASRKRKGSRNRRKAVAELARLHRRIANIRRDFLHKASSALARTKPAICVEAMRVGDMLLPGRGPGYARNINRAMADAGIGEFLRMLAYKTAWHGSALVLPPEGYAATRTCSECGWEGPELPPSRRVFRCGACGLEIDRDLNAARNLEKPAEEFLNNAPAA